MAALSRPFVAFDAGIGSYAVVDMIRRRYPLQDVLYVADRASFPYGAKSAAELLGCVQRVIDATLAVGPSVILVASNAPSVMVFDRLVVPPCVALRGVFPPIRESLRISKSKQVVVMGVRSLTDSLAFHEFTAAERAAVGSLQAKVEGVNASPLVELVESAVFLSDPERAQAQVSDFIANTRRQWPQADVYMLSSTHLPWLRSCFERAAPDIRFLDPAQSIIDDLESFTTVGSGRLETWVTDNPRYPVAEFAALLERLRINVPYSVRELE
jgi:glutamate racemase